MQLTLLHISYHMGKKIIKQIAAFAMTALLSAFMIAPAFADSYTTSVVNNASISDINIEIHEYEYDRTGMLIPYEDYKTVVPGQTVDKIVRINNIAADAWIRIKVDYLSEDGDMELSDDMLVLGSDLWIKRGDYFYYTEPVKTGDYVDFIKQVHIPEIWKEDYGGYRFVFAFAADAVQVRNFTPDFNSTDPWFGTLIEHCVHQGYEDPSEIVQQNFSVKFVAGAEGFIRVGDDFFSNWNAMLPGDRLTDEVLVQNNYEYPVTIYFHTETIANDDLLKQLDLTIKNNDTVIYDGKMDGVRDKIALATLNKGENVTLYYEVHVPEELTNIYALTETQTKWVFTAEIHWPATGGPGVRTGDLFDVQHIMICGTVFAVIGVLALNVVVGRKKEAAKNEMLK